MVLFQLLGFISSLLVLTLYIPILILSLWSYYNVVFTHPGIPLKTFKEEDRDSSSYSHDSITIPMTQENELVECLEAKRNGKPRYCKKCQNIKPDRTHHCSICNSCVLKMDHHCPWMNNCVGFYNYKFFVQFLIYTDVYCLIIFTTCIGILYAHSLDIYSIDFQFVILLIVSAAFGFCLFAFAFIHCYYIYYNCTTIEAMEGDRRLKLQDSSVKIARGINIYDLGVYKNFNSVFGKTFKSRFLPIHVEKLGDGHYFEINDALYYSLK